MSQDSSIWPNSRITLKPPPCIDPTKATLAYGRLAIPRLNRELQDIDLLTRQRAIKTLCDYLHDPEHIYEAVSGRIIPTLIKLLSDNDESIRAMTAECFITFNRKLMKNHNSGREKFVENHVYDAMKLLFSENEKDVIRLKAHRSIELLVLNPLYAEILIVILDSVSKCLELNPEEGLDANGIEAFSTTLMHSNSNVRYKSAQAILLLVANDRGKTEAIEKGVVPKLVDLLTDSNSEVQASAAGALAFICVKTEGRHSYLKSFATSSLLQCLLNSNSRVRANALKALGCIAESPEGRRMLQISLEQIESLMRDENAAVRKHAKITADIVKWKPWYTEVKCPEENI
ncbi:hypothetical protein ACTXT7_005160 [Hymenolepis weldensis]